MLHVQQVYYMLCLACMAFRCWGTQVYLKLCISRSDCKSDVSSSEAKFLASTSKAVPGPAVDSDTNLKNPAA